MTAAYVSGVGGPALLGDTIGRNLARTVACFGEREALVDLPSGRRWTYTELGAAVEELARALLAHGVAKGDRVGIWSPNCPEWMLVQLAAARVGAILVSLNPAYAAHELAYTLRQSGVSLLFATTGFKQVDGRELVAGVRADCPQLREVVHIQDPDWEAFATAAEQVGADQLAVREAELSCDDPINIQYTSGTTGFPKGATLSHHNILNNAYLSGEILGYTEHDRICLPVPLYHTFGMVLGTLGTIARGACAVLPAAVFDPGATLRAVAEERCTSLYGVPTMFIAELSHPDFADFDLTSLRTGVMGGSPCPVEVMKRVIAEMHMTGVTIAYGMTETSPVATLTRGDDDIARRTETVGAVIPHVEIKVADPVTGRPVDRGEKGELCVRGHSVMLGYWDDPERTADAIDAARWMHTGDLAVMGEDGYLQIVGQIKDLIIRGGENVYPREVEEFLYTHPAITDVQVVGVPDERYGEEVAACVILADGTGTLTQAEVAAFCQGQLARFKVPRYVRVMDAFPLTASGKVRKVELRELLVAELSQDG